MACHHSEPGLNIFNESRLTLALPALEIFKISSSSVKSSGCVSSFPRLSKNKAYPFVTAKVRFSVPSPKKPPRWKPWWLFIQRFLMNGAGRSERIRTSAPCSRSRFFAYLIRQKPSKTLTFCKKILSIVSQHTPKRGTVWCGQRRRLRRYWVCHMSPKFTNYAHKKKHKLTWKIFIWS